MSDSPDSIHSLVEKMVKDVQAAGNEIIQIIHKHELSDIQIKSLLHALLFMLAKANNQSLHELLQEITNIHKATHQLGESN